MPYFPMFHMNVSHSVFYTFRKCNNCEKLFASELGLKDHIKRQNGKPCGLLAASVKRRANQTFYAKVKTRVQSKKFNSLGPFKNMAGTKTRSKGQVLLTKEKQTILRNFDYFHGEMNEKVSKVRLHFLDFVKVR